MSKRKKEIILFIIGAVMLIVGLGRLMTSRIADISTFQIYIGGVPVVKLLIMLPFIIGIVWLFIGTHKKTAQIIMGIGMCIIVAALVISMKYKYEPIVVYSYVSMLALIFGGLWLMIKASTS